MKQSPYRLRLERGEGAAYDVRMAIVGVVPAAGYAERLQPLECSKEVLPVAGRPVVDYVVERMRVGGCGEVRVVTRPEKRDVVAYAEQSGASLVLGRPRNICESFAAGMAGLAPDDIVLLGYPDSLWEPVDGYKPLVEAVEGGGEVALGMFEAPGLVGSDFLRLDDAGRIVGFEIKPPRPPSSWIWGCAAARFRALEGIEREEWPSAYFDSLRRRGVDLKGIRLSDEYLDIGTEESLRRLASSRWVTSPQA
jgi:glucose-1-phosphate thymidylyltransferase